MATVLAAPFGVGMPQAAGDGVRSLAEARAWLARELHDGAVQRLTFMTVELEGLKRRTGLRDELDQLQRSTRAALNDLRSLLYQLRDEPPIDNGFAGSVGAMVSDLATVTTIQAELTLRSWPGELPAHQAHQLRRIVGEALSNVRRHSGAGRVRVTLDTVDSAFLVLTVADNGRGMGGSEGGFGLRGMTERARLLGGRIEVTETPGGGTTVRCFVPMGGPG